MKKQQIRVGLVVTPTPNSAGCGYVINIEDAAFIAVFIQKLLKPFLPDIKVEIESLQTPVSCASWDGDAILHHLCNGWAEIVYEVDLDDDIKACVNTKREAEILASKSWVSSTIQIKVVKL